MELREQLEADGDWLFQRRSVLPLVLIPVLVAALCKPDHNRSIAGPVDWTACALAAIGVLLRACVVGFVPPGTSGRNMQRQRATTLNTSGLYSIVRHPLYIGNFLVTIGWSLASGSAWLTLVAGLLFWLYYERIALREEAFLRERFGAAFSTWATTTPACLPRQLMWIPPERPFSWSMVARREYQTVCLVIAGFVLVHLLRCAFVPADLRDAPRWIWIGVTDATLFLTAWLAMRLRRSRVHRRLTASAESG
jgi:protein-S-isoprenylcysteine O-methyltransferase Ste14